MVALYCAWLCTLTLSLSPFLTCSVGPGNCPFTVMILCVPHNLFTGVDRSWILRLTSHKHHYFKLTWLVHVTHIQWTEATTKNNFPEKLVWKNLLCVYQCYWQNGPWSASIKQSNNTTQIKQYSSLFYQNIIYVYMENIEGGKTYNEYVSV